MILAFVDIMKSFIFSLMFFIVGIIIGFGLLMLVYLIITKIAKKKVDKPDEIIPNMAQKPINEIISLYVGEYNISYSNKTLSKRIGYVKDYSLKMIEDIAESYYPNEKNPILSISLEDSVKLSQQFL